MDVSGTAAAPGAQGHESSLPSGTAEILFAAGRDGVAIFDEEGELINWSAGAAVITGWDHPSAARWLPADVRPGLVELSPGHWVEVRRHELPGGGHVVLLADARDQIALREAYARLSELSTTDPLTGLPNRSLLEERLRLSLGLASPARRPVAVLVVDVDGFTTVNDALGRQAGDELLRSVAGRIRESISDSDTAARLGGDEFAIVLHLPPSAEAAELTAGRIVRSLAMPFRLSGQEVYLGCSVGVAVFPTDGHDAQELLRHADLAMSRAKLEGGSRLRRYAPELSTTSLERVTVAAELRRAVTRDQMSVYFQPQVDISSGQIVGAEALLRWRHPARGLLAPDRFLAVASDDGSIVDIDLWVIDRVCVHLHEWDRLGLDVPRIGVNLSARTLAEPDLTGRIAQILDHTGVAPHRLEVEVTEHVVASQPRLIETLEALRALGVEIAVDDFGTGYSNLGHLKRLPLDTIKLDKSFVEDVTEKPQAGDMAILRAVVSLARDLGLRCIAEGVETIGQRRALRYLTCHLVQGFLYSRPLPAAQFTELLADTGATPIPSYR